MFPGDGHILVRCPGHVDLDAGSVIHDIVAAGVVAESVCPKQNVDPIAARTYFGVAVHQVNDICRRLLDIAGVCNAVVQVDSAQAVEDPDADAVISVCLHCFRKRNEAARIVAPCSLTC